MPSILPGYEYDIFISYRHNDNRTGGVTEFVEHLKAELAATIKEPLSIYFDTNPHDGLLENHDVDKSLERKLKCLIFIPIISQTYCDPKSFAWQHEFVAFNKLAKEDSLGRDVLLGNGNVASRILPIKIHELDADDTAAVENEIGGALRAIEFIYKEPGVNRPLKVTDERSNNQNKTDYDNQVNKVANAIKEIIASINPSGKSLSARIENKIIRPTKSTRKSGAIISAIIIIIALAGYFLYPKVIPAITPEEIEKSIAVLPFSDLSQAGDQQYFADGVMEDILTQLQKMGELRVTSRTSVEQYRNTSKPMTTIGNELNVSYVLEGSVRKAANQIMITAQLINTQNDSHVWSDSFISEYTIEGLFDIQRQIAEGIVSKLRLKISTEKLQEITQAQTNNKEAYEHFIRGRLLYSQNTYASNERSIEEFKLAIQEDPQFAAAYGGIASSFIKRNWSYAFPAIWRDSASTYATKGIKLDANCAECYRALALNVTTKDYEFGKSKLGMEYYEKALSINPNYESARTSVSIFYIWRGNYRKVFDNIALQHENGNKAMMLSWFHFFASGGEKSRDYSKKALSIQKDRNASGRLQDALVDIGDAVGIRKATIVKAELSNNEEERHRGELMALWAEGRYQDLVNYYEENNLDFTIPFFHCITYSYYLTGRTEMAKERAKNSLNRLLSVYNNNLQTIERNWQYYNLAFYYLMLDEKEKALESLQSAVNMGWLRSLSKEKIFESLRNDPRFQALVKKQNQKQEEVMALYASYHFPEPDDL